MTGIICQRARHLKDRLCDPTSFIAAPVSVTLSFMLLGCFYISLIVFKFLKDFMFSSNDFFVEFYYSCHVVVLFSFAIQIVFLSVVRLAKHHG